MSFLLSSMRRAPSAVSFQTARAFSTTKPSQLARMTLVGRLGSDVEVSETANGQQLTKYIVGSNTGPRSKQTTSWFKVVSFSQPDSPQGNYMKTLQKGTLIYLEGDAAIQVYEDRDGKKQSSFNLVQTKLDVLKRPSEASSGSDDSQNGV